MRSSKYHSKKIETPDGAFDSKKEYKRWLLLKELEQEGIICNLKRQVEYELIPRQELPRPKLEKGRMRKVELPCIYKADFAYSMQGTTIVEDVKGFKTKDYVIKRKLMLFRHGIQIKEI